MSKITVLIFAATFAALASPAVKAQTDSGCESGHWVEFVSNGGKIVILENSTIWEVDAVGVVESALWLPATHVVACDDKLINTDRHQTVSARRIR